MRPRIAALLVAIGITAGCGEGLPSEEVPLDGSWRDEYGYDTYSSGWFFERHADGATYGGWHHEWTPGGSYQTSIDTAWVAYPDILVRMVMDGAGNCWPEGRIGGCSPTGRFLSRNRIEISGQTFRRTSQ